MNNRRLNPTVVNAWHAALGELCACNGPVELVPRTDTGEALPRVRARLLRADAADGSLIVEKPAAQPQAEVLRKGVAVEMYVTTATSRMKAWSAVLDLGRFSLNEQTRVIAYRLEPVRDIASAQRRACFRLPTAGMAMGAGLWDPAWPEFQPRVEGHVTDLSDRGVGITAALEIELARQMQGRVYKLSIPLGEAGEALDVDARMVRIFESESDTVSLGLEFEFTGLAEQHRVEHMLQQFSVEQQRKQLRRMRGTG